MTVVLSLRRHRLRVTRAALRVLRSGGILVFPTDTVYGVGGDALKPSVVRRLRKVKGRSHGKPFPWLVSDLAMAERYGEFSVATKQFARKVWPGATTLVVRRKRGKSLGQMTVGLRVPDHPWLRQLIRRFGKPLIGTSANKSGGRPARTLREAMEAVGCGDLLVDGGRCAEKPSAVVDCTKAAPRLIRR